jgi:hypothetical protein
MRSIPAVSSSLSHHPISHCPSHLDSLQFLRDCLRNTDTASMLPSQSCRLVSSPTRLPISYRRSTLMGCTRCEAPAYPTILRVQQCSWPAKMRNGSQASTYQLTVAIRRSDVVIVGSWRAPCPQKDVPRMKGRGHRWPRSLGRARRHRKGNRKSQSN